MTSRQIEPQTSLQLNERSLGVSQVSRPRQMAGSFSSIAWTGSRVTSCLWRTFGERDAGDSGSHIRRGVQANCMFGRSQADDDREFQVGVQPNSANVAAAERDSALGRG